MELWNERNLPITLMTENRVSRTSIDSRKLKSILQSLIDSFSHTKSFHEEVAQLSRFIFMNVKQFRMVRGLKEMQKTHQALLRYLNLDILTSFENFKSFIQEERDCVIIPHRHSLDFLLVRLQGLSKLLIRAVSTTRKAAKFYFGVLRCGNFHVKSILFLSTFSSIWEHCRSICRVVVKNYNELMKFRLKIAEKPGFRLVEGDYELPEKLDKWLGAEYDELMVKEISESKLLSLKDDLNEMKLAHLDKYFVAEIDDEAETERMDADNEEIPNEQGMNPFCRSAEMEIEDFTPIPRVDSQVVVDDETVKVQTDETQAGKFNVKDFIKNETYYRKHKDSKSLTINKMTKKEWKEFANDIKNKVVLLPECSLLEYVKDHLEDYDIDI